MMYKYCIGFRRDQKRDGNVIYWLAYGTSCDNESTNWELDGELTSESKMKPIIDLAKSNDAQIKFIEYSKEENDEYCEESDFITSSGGTNLLANYPSLEIQSLIVSANLESKLEYFAKNVANLTEITPCQLRKIIKNHKM